MTNRTRPCYVRDQEETAITARLQRITAYIAAAVLTPVVCVLTVVGFLYVVLLLPFIAGYHALIKHGP